MKNYVLGFLFNEALTHVWLIEKNRPKTESKWQTGKLNGIGGKFEDSDNGDPLTAMIREFKEEGGVEILNWEALGVLIGPDWRVHLFRQRGDYKVEAKTDEAVHLIPVDEVFRYQHIPNLKWLLPMALDPEVMLATVYSSLVT